MDTTDISRPNTTEVSSKIRAVLAAHGRLPVDPGTIDEHTDLYRAGMTSHASVNVMLALEDAFDLEFPDEMLTRDVFQTIATIDAAMQELAIEHAA